MKEFTLLFIATCIALSSARYRGPQRGGVRDSDYERHRQHIVSHKSILLNPNEHAVGYKHTNRPGHHFKRPTDYYEETNEIWPNILRKRRQTEDPCNLTNTIRVQCKTSNNLDGICLPNYQCTDDKNMAIGGKLDASDFRISTCLPIDGQIAWCCTCGNKTTNKAGHGLLPGVATTTVPEVTSGNPSKFHYCLSTTGHSGVCLSESVCEPDAKISIESLRSPSCSVSEICCTNETPEQAPEPSPKRQCSVDDTGKTGVCLNQKQCYPNGGDVQDGYRFGDECPLPEICCPRNNTPPDTERQCSVDDTGKAGVCLTQLLCYPNGGDVEDGYRSRGECLPSEICCPRNNTPPDARAVCTYRGTQGRCYPSHQCYDNHTVALSGQLYLSDFRQETYQSKGCAKMEWCCFDGSNEATIVPDPTPPTSRDCELGDGKSCPWCVGLYRNYGNPRLRNRSGLYCGGVMVSKRVVLTTAVCIGDSFWVQVPSADDPKKKYEVATIIKHRLYKELNRLYNIALLKLTEEVSWTLKPPCIGFKTDLIRESRCFVPGFVSNDTILMTEIEVLNCPDQGLVDSVCATSLGEKCYISNGFPAFCPFNNNQFSLAGMVKYPCTGEKITVTITTITKSIIASFLKESFKSLGVDDTKLNALPQLT